jgi:hypothetical protein
MDNISGRERTWKSVYLIIFPHIVGFLSVIVLLVLKGEARLTRWKV